jgi:hypothetical protein
LVEGRSDTNVRLMLSSKGNVIDEWSCEKLLRERDSAFCART